MKMLSKEPKFTLFPEPGVSLLKYPNDEQNPENISEKNKRKRKEMEYDQHNMGKFTETPWYIAPKKTSTKKIISYEDPLTKMYDETLNLKPQKKRDLRTERLQRQQDERQRLNLIK